MTITTMEGISPKLAIEQPKVEKIIIHEGAIPRPEVVQSLGHVSSDTNDANALPAHRDLQQDLPRDYEEIIVIARNVEGTPSAAAIAVVSKELEAAVSVKRFKAQNPEDGIVVIEALKEAVEARFSEIERKPVVHVTPFAEMNQEEVLADVSKPGTHAHYGPGRVLK